MRIREIVFNNVRSFRGEHRISFVDPLTDEARPVTVIAGTNGTGKTTIIEAIEALLQFALNLSIEPNSLLAELAADGFVSLTLELSSLDISENESPDAQTLSLMVGRKELAPTEIPPQTIRCLWASSQPITAASPLAGELKPRRELIGKVSEMQRGQTALRGGLLYFPQHRQLFPASIRAGGIVPPPPDLAWLSRIVSPNQWQGSLESLWVWQNYLDLEAGADGRNGSNLQPFVQAVEEVLGRERKITVRQGRVQVPANWRQNGDSGALVRLDQLPSGEQQCLFLLGELARRRRSGAVIAIDEPETSLHPTLQRMLVHQLRKLAREWDCQLILATHSLEVLRAVHKSARLNLDHLDQQSEPAETEVEAA